MPRMSNVYTVTFHQPPAPGAPFRYTISEPVEVHAMDEASAQRLARRYLELDDSWLVRECHNAGAWNRQ